MGKLAWLVVVWFAVVSGTLFAQEVTMSAALPYGAVFVPESETPVRVDVRNSTDRLIDGTIRLTSLDGSLPEYQAPMRIAPHSRLSTTLWVTLAPGAKNSTGRATLHDASGAQIARTEMAGAPVNPQVTFQVNGVPDSGYMLGIVGSDVYGDIQALDNFKEAVASSIDLKLALADMDPVDAPRSPAAYRAALGIQFRGIDPSLLDIAQQSAIRDYLASGGMLMVNAPDPAKINGSWLEDLMPVRLVGMRELKEIKPRGLPVMPLVSWVPCTEAIAGQGTVVAGDDQYVYAAYRPYGLGRVVFTSFPSGGMTAKVSESLWKQLFGANRAPAGVAGSGIARSYGQLMEPMLGRPAAPWYVAAFAALGIVGLALVSHAFWRGASRPQAFALTLGAGVAVAGVFGVMAMLRQKTDPLQEARLCVVDATPTGALVSEYAAIAGPPQTLARMTSDDRATIEQALNRQERALISYWPGKVQRIDVRPQQVQLVTLATNFDRQNNARAVGRFTSQGLSISLENSLPVPLRLAQLGWGRYRVGMDDVPLGKSSALAGSAAVRPDEEFTSRSGVPSQDELYKAQILRTLLRGTDSEARSRGVWPTVYGWADDYPALTSVVGAKTDRGAGQTIVRIPLTLTPSAPGDNVRIDGVFASYVIGQARGLPYDPQMGVFLRSSLVGRWLFGIRAPAEAGKIMPSKAHVQIDLATPEHEIILHGGQAVGGKRPTKEKADGRTLQQWAREVGSKSFEFQCTSDDVDEDGTLWLLIEVRKSGGGGALGVEPQWRFGQLLVDLEGKVQ